MKRTYESGAQKRKKKAEKDEEVKKLPKLDQFFIKVNENTTGLETKNLSAITETSTIACCESFPISAITLNDLSAQINRQSDAELWADFSKEDVELWIQKGPEVCQNINDTFLVSKLSYAENDRYCPKNLFISKKANGEDFKREWLIYSPSPGNVFCFVCELFRVSQFALATHGFRDWKNSFSSLKSHENSPELREALMKYLERKNNYSVKVQLDSEIRKERNFWRQVLKRVVAVICTLIEKNLAFSGSNKSFGKESNDNFIGLLEHISKFDPFLSEHIENYGNVGSGKNNYFSKTVCDELVVLEVKYSKYFGLSVDSTPDISHKDQLCIILRYVDEPIKRFINFVQVEDHSGEKLAEVTINFLDSTLSLDISNCRSQSYDNALINFFGIV
ncbi:zinc finger MYM-type protein 5-like [Hydra vulgaris]|uniref:Zinc finger MYM-type protein 5-like n=1 Tax=Hydra vulgaris TaxID=6087 RepID=A0ABM4B999_HYDVU